MVPEGATRPKVTSQVLASAAEATGARFLWAFCCAPAGLDGCRTQWGRRVWLETVADRGKRVDKGRVLQGRCNEVVDNSLDGPPAVPVTFEAPEGATNI